LPLHPHTHTPVPTPTLPLPHCFHIPLPLLPLHILVTLPLDPIWLGKFIYYSLLDPFLYTLTHSSLVAPHPGHTPLYIGLDYLGLVGLPVYLDYGLYLRCFLLDLVPPLGLVVWITPLVVLGSQHCIICWFGFGCPVGHPSCPCALGPYIAAPLGPLVWLGLPQVWLVAPLPVVWTHPFYLPLGCVLPLVYSLPRLDTPVTLPLWLDTLAFGLTCLALWLGPPWLPWWLDPCPHTVPIAFPHIPPHTPGPLRHLVYPGLDICPLGLPLAISAHALGSPWFLLVLAPCDMVGLVTPWTHIACPLTHICPAFTHPHTGLLVPCCPGLHTFTCITPFACPLGCCPLVDIWTLHCPTFIYIVIVPIIITPIVSLVYLFTLLPYLVRLHITTLCWFGWLVVFPCSWLGWTPLGWFILFWFDLTHIRSLLIYIHVHARTHCTF